MDPLLLRVVASSVSIANKCGEIIRNILKTGDLGIVDKGINDLQTEADRSVQKCIVASLSKQYPKATIIGEEVLNQNEPINPSWIISDKSEDVLNKRDQLPDKYKNIKEEDICIWVDPLDGTQEFTQGLLDHVTVLIGIAVNEKAIGGVIYQPYYNYQSGDNAKLGRMVWGIVDLGAFGHNKNFKRNDVRIITTTRSHLTEAVQKAIDACKPCEVLKVGGAGHKVLLLIDGLADAYLFASPGCKKWDTCAPEAVLHAMGGKLTDVKGNYYQYHATVDKRNKDGTLATSIKEQHKWYLDRMSDDITGNMTYK